MKKLRKWAGYLFPLLVVLLLVGLILSRVYQPEPDLEPEVTVSAFEAIEFEGKTVRVCDRVESADYLPDINGQPTFLNLGRAYPEQLFTAVIWGEDRGRWNFPPEEYYLTREICVTGRIGMHEGTPQIRVRSPDQIEFQ